MDNSRSLDDLISQFGHSAAPGTEQAARLGAAAQLQRKQNGFSDRGEITRSTALWALSSIDATVADALREGGLRPGQLGSKLGISVPVQSATGAALLDQEMADAVEAYLGKLPGSVEIVPVDLAIAILQSGLDSGGLLAGRLAELELNYSVALGALERLIAGRAGYPFSEESGSPYEPSAARRKTATPKTATQKSAGEEPSPEGSTSPSPPPNADDATEAQPGEPFSRSVLDARDRLGATTPVTASAFAAEFQVLGSGYFTKEFTFVPLRVKQGAPAPVADWLERVRGLYDEAAVAASRHEVIDEELLLIGLAELDETLEDDLTSCGVLGVWRESVAVLPRNTRVDRTKWTSDTPADVDLLGRRFLAEALANRLRSMAEDDRNSFLVHIDGAWGSGKSSLFRFLEDQLRKDFLIVKVNAWREQQVGVQWWTLHNALRQAVEADAAHPFWARTQGRLDVIRTRLVPFLAVITVLLGVVLGLLLLARLDVTTGSQLADSIGKIVSVAALGLAGLTAAYRFLMPDSRRSAEAFVAKSANPMWEVQRLFARTLRRTTKSAVFLIDDLDRCDAEYIIEFLEVMQTLVREPPAQLRKGKPAQRPAGPYAFIAADGQWIRSSYESHFTTVRLTEVPGRPLGYLFLEKIFQLQVRLPSITENATKAFFESLLTGQTEPSPSADQSRLQQSITEEVESATTAPEISRAAERAQGIESPEERMKVLGAAAVKFSDATVQQGTRHELARYWRLLEPNPRSIKLFVHTFGTLQSLRTLEGIPLHTTPLALWTIVEIRWPMLADHLRAHPDDIEATGAPEPIKALLARADVAAVVASAQWGPLTPAQVRECTGTRTHSTPDTD